MRVLFLPLLASALSGVSALIEKVSVVTLSPLTVLTLRYALMLPVLLVALSLTGGHREVRRLDSRTFGSVALPAVNARITSQLQAPATFLAAAGLAARRRVGLEPRRSARSR